MSPRYPKRTGSRAPGRGAPQFKPILACLPTRICAVAAFSLCRHVPAEVRAFECLIFLMIVSSSHAHEPISVGKYRIASCARQTAGGAYAAQVSIASGRGRSSTDRVMRFIPEFPSLDAASRYAVEQGLNWVRDATRSR